ncbi:MAG: 50S ribosomal protein L4 [Christensenellaceae bacterium]|jgi:large subunit ribosomal protein L4|nr:50S ribosomal protein L4 [Christensenellaceae bacterium]
MISVNVLNLEGEVVGQTELCEEYFGADYNEPLIHQVVVAQLANKRQGTKCTLTRTEVRGGGIKPWRQKGTGRARQGSIRAPQWIHGGVVFAPKPRDFSKKINQKMKAAALKSALSRKLADGSVIVVENFNIDAPKTKLVAIALKKLNIEKRALIIVSGEKANLLRASRNIQKLVVSDIALMNIYDIVSAHTCIFTKQAVELISASCKLKDCDSEVNE